MLLCVMLFMCYVIYVMLCYYVLCYFFMLLCVMLFMCYSYMQCLESSAPTPRYLSGTLVGITLK